MFAHDDELRKKLLLVKSFRNKIKVSSYNYELNVVVVRETIQNYFEPDIEQVNRRICSHNSFRGGCVAPRTHTHTHETERDGISCVDRADYSGISSILNDFVKTSEFKNSSISSKASIYLTAN